MRPIPVAQYLDRLVETPPIAVMGALAMATAPSEAADARALADREREAAYLRGTADGEARAAATHERLLEQERAAAEARLRAEQTRWAAEEGARLAQSLSGAIEALAERLADQAGRLLEPFVEARILARALAELRQALGQLLAGGEGAGVRVCGPADLLAALREGAGASAAAVEFVEAEGIDVRIVAADSIIESRLAEWMERLREAVA